MENIGNITGFWQFAAMIFLTIFVPYFTKWLQTKEFKKSEAKNDDFRTSQKKQYDNIENKINSLLNRVEREELETKRSNLRCLILHFDSITTTSEQIKRKQLIDELYFEYVNNGGNSIISTLYDDFIEKYNNGYYKIKKVAKTA
ncbi:MAG TPA: hypothetical protein P5215_07620 [Bacteroidales bacterium]|nr:hypothetical protein [Bacteroidales bacterium]